MKKIAPVLLIFFNRPDTLKIVFEEVRKAKPQKLYLAQDGARENRPDDIENIKKCREIVKNIDWECEVFTNYLEKNCGCGRGPQRAINWLFENEEEGVILEDDCVPAPSFFTFCTEMLERYREDERIFLITGCNSELQSLEVKESYFFGYAGTNSGWATWKRNWVKMDYACSWVSNEAVCKSVRHLISTVNKTAAKCEIKSFIETNKLVNSGVNISYWDVQFQAIRYLNHQLSIIPQKNLITNIGLGATSSHAQGAKIPKKEHSTIGKINVTYNRRFDFDNSFVHPEFVVENINYDKRLYGYLYPPFVVKLVKKILRVLKFR